MDRKMFSIIMGALLLIGFFLAYFSFLGIGISGYDMVFSKEGNWQKYILLLIPLSGLLLLIGELGGTYLLSRGLLCWLPLLALLFTIIINPLIEGAAVGDVFKNIGKGYGIGLWLSLLASLLLAFYHPKPKA